MDVAALGLAFAVVAAALWLLPNAADRLPARSVPAAAAVSALAAAAAPPDPTGWVVLDVFLRGALGFSLAWGASRAAVGWTVASAIVAAGSLLWAESPVAPLGFAAVGVVAALLAAGVRQPVLQAVAGAFVAQTVLRLEWDTLGASLAAGTLASLLLLLPALRFVPGRVCRPLKWSIGIAVLLVIVGSAVAAIGVASIYRDVDRAIDTARAGIDSLSDDEGGAGARLRESSALFADARDTMDAWWAKPARLVPIVAQHSRAVATLAGSGADLAETAADALDAADPDNVRLADGTIDLDALRDLQGPLGDARDSLRRARAALDDVDSPWLLAPLADRYDELFAEVEGRSDEVETAALAAELAPTLLGGDGPRRYFLAVETPAELRAGGGVLGNYGEIVADGGNLDLIRFGRTQELNETGMPAPERELDLPDEVRAVYGDPFSMHQYWQNVAASPDLAVEADVIRQLYPQSGGDEIDGVIVVDPYAIAAVLRITGPVQLPGLDQPLSADNAVPFLLHEQYLQFEQSERVDFLGDAAEITWERLTTGELPGPAALVEALAPAVAGGHLQVLTFHDEDAPLLQRAGLDGRLRPPTADGFGAFLQNGGLNKIDWFLHRSSTYRATWDPDTGDVAGTLSVTMRNDAPATGLPQSIIGYGGPLDVPFQTVDGENGGIATFYTALPVRSVRVDGEALGVYGSYRDGAWYVTTFANRIPAGATQVVELHVAGRVAGPYALDVLAQSASHDDEVDVDITVADGWRPEQVLGEATGAGQAVRATWLLDRPRGLAIVASER